MAKSLTQIQQQIDKLQREADAIRNTEKKGVIDRIREAIATYGFTAQELGLSGGTSSKPKRVSTTKKGKAASPGKYKTAIQYRDRAGNEWSGHGRRPQWFLDALASGMTAEQLSV